MRILVATEREILVIDAESGTSEPARGMTDRPTCLAVHESGAGRAFCGTHSAGMFRSEDGGRSWQPTGLAGRLITTVAASPSTKDVVWAGTEPSEVWRSDDAVVRMTAESAGAAWPDMPLRQTTCAASRCSADIGSGDLM